MQQVFDEFSACLKPGALLFVSPLAGTPLHQNVKPGAKTLLGRTGGQEVGLSGFGRGGGVQGIGAAMTEKPWDDVAPNERDEIDQAVPELRERLERIVHDLGGVALETEKLRSEVTDFRGVLAELREWVGEQRRRRQTLESE